MGVCGGGGSVATFLSLPELAEASFKASTHQKTASLGSLTSDRGFKLAIVEGEIFFEHWKQGQILIPLKIKESEVTSACSF